MSEKKVCAVCGGEATQTHHLSYDPEIEIQLCVPCHLEVHQHGVGLGRGEQKFVTEKIEEQEPILPLFTKEEVIDGKHTVLSLENEVLKDLVCPNCGVEGEWRPLSWKLYGDEQKRTFLRCPLCGYDHQIRVLPRDKF